MDCETPLAEEKVKKHHSGRLMINRVCNERCVFCSTPPVGGELPFEEVKKRMLRLKEEGTDELVITGGEPTLKKDFIEILELAQKMGFEEITVQSNGTMFFREEFVQQLAKMKCNLKISVSFHSSDEKTFGELTKAPYAYKNVLKGLELLGKYEIFTLIVTVIQTANYPHLKEHLKFICDNYPFIKHFSFNFIDPVYWAKDNAWTVPSFSEASPFIREAFQYLQDNGKTFRIEKIPLCFIRDFEHNHSDLRRDIFNDKLMNMFFKRPTDTGVGGEWHVHSNSSYFYAPQCKECSLQSICSGINRQYIDIHGYDDILPVHDRDPAEILSKARESELTTNPHRVVTNGSLASLMPHLRKDPFRHMVSEDMLFFEKAMQKFGNIDLLKNTFANFFSNPASVRKERLKFIIQRFQATRSLSREEYRKAFAQDIIMDFPHAVRALELLGVIDIDSKNIQFGDWEEKSYYPFFLFFVGRKNVEHALQVSEIALEIKA